MAKNSLQDLNDTLFEVMERLNDDDLLDDPAKLNKEIDRARAINGVASKILDVGRLALDHATARSEHDLTGDRLPLLTKSTKENEK